MGPAAVVAAAAAAAEVDSAVKRIVSQDSCTCAGRALVYCCSPPPHTHAHQESRPLPMNRTSAALIPSVCARELISLRDTGHERRFTQRSAMYAPSRPARPPAAQHSTAQQSGAQCSTAELPRCSGGGVLCVGRAQCKWSMHRNVVRIHILARTVCTQHCVSLRAYLKSQAN